MPEALRRYHAQCHCGAVTALFVTREPPQSWRVRACQCSFCRAHAALSVSDPRGQLRFSAALTLPTYRFGSGTTEFVVCDRCGVYLGAQLRTAGAPLGVLNARALRPIPADLPEAQPMDYSGESLAAREARRRARWTPLLAAAPADDGASA